MREIKFRGKRIEDGEWLCGDLYHHNEQTLIKPIFTEPYEYPEDYDQNVIPETVGQYTGLKDNNDKEIYEGDISIGEHATYSIYWRDEKAQFMAKVVKSTTVLIRHNSFPLWQYNEDGKCRFEIIGNIHEHPNLLSKE